MKLDTLWYTRQPAALLLLLPLLPLSGLYCLLMSLRRLAYRQGWLRSARCAVPVIVVGNLTLGGTGKTPLVIWLAQFMRKHGYKPGIVSRGYKGKAKHWPQAVQSNSDPLLVGDEALLLARHSGCPVAVGPDRHAAVQALLSAHSCDLIISDDGLQHYGLHRDVEILMVDDIRRYGNGFCLPAGPLREPLQRLQDADFIVTKGATLEHEFSMQYQMKDLVGVADSQRSLPLAQLRGKKVHAVAGIGHPERFFARLVDLGIKVVPHPYPDHHIFRAADIHFADELPVVMTEKDAVKCHTLAGPQHWYIPIEAHLPLDFGERLLKHLTLRTAPHG